MSNEPNDQRHQRKTAAFRHLGDVKVEIAVELGRKNLRLSEAMYLRKGDCIELDKLAGEAFAVSLNGYPFAEGEIVVVADYAACRITRVRPVARR